MAAITQGPAFLYGFDGSIARCAVQSVTRKWSFANVNEVLNEQGNGLQVNFCHFQIESRHAYGLIFCSNQTASLSLVLCFQALSASRTKFFGVEHPIRAVIKTKPILHLRNSSCVGILVKSIPSQVRSVTPYAQLLAYF